MSEIDQNTPGFGISRFHFSRWWNSSACGFNCSSMGTITAIPCIGRSTVRNTFSSDSLYSSFTFRTRSSELLFTSITRPRRYVARLSFRIELDKRHRRTRSYGASTICTTGLTWQYVPVNACLRVQYEIYFASHFLPVVICTSAKREIFSIV